MVVLKSSQSHHEIHFSEAFRLAEGEPILRFRVSFQMGSLPYLTVWVLHAHPVDLVEYFHRLLRLVRSPEEAHRQLNVEAFSWRSAEGHLLFRGEETDAGMLRLESAICTVPRRDPLGTSLSMVVSDGTLTTFLTELAQFFSVDLPGSVMLPQENWDEWTATDPQGLSVQAGSARSASSPSSDLAASGEKAAQTTETTKAAQEAREDIWLEGHTPPPASPSQVDLEGWGDD
ncbi:hypothetical protein L6R29_07290 [Myxococcota bacterium]|nr:hypothetical protein [Myxococcota bacterium]